MNLFNAASSAALVSSSISLLTAGAAWLVGGAPGWQDYRRFTWVAASAALVSACNFPTTLDLPTPVHLLSQRTQVFLLALHLCAWIVYLEAWGRRPLRRLDWLVLAAVAGLGALAFVPGVMYRDELALRTVRWMGITYRDPITTPSGTAIAVFLLATGLARLARAARIARAGAPLPRVHLAAGVLVLAIGIHDAAVVCGVSLGTPSFLDVGFLIPILSMAIAGTYRLVGHAGELERLKSRLEEAVAERTRELERAQVALARAERLAALGQFSAGVAHEVNNPAAAISSNLHSLKAQLGAELRRDLAECLDDSAAAVERIAELTRQLLFAGRTAAAEPSSLVAVDMSPAVDAALRAVRARVGPEVTLESQVPRGLAALACEGALVQVLSNLALNGAQAIPQGRPGRVTVRGAVEGERVVVTVEDDGDGISAEAMSHLFEPFYSTKPWGGGTGLGLAVSRGLVDAMHGALRFESAPGRGTRVSLDLPSGGGAAPARTPPPTASTLAPASWRAA